MNSVIVVNNLVYEYPGKRALDGVSFSLARGGVTALVGPNGSGKTTLLRCIAALDTPYSGYVKLDGMDTQEFPRECHAKIGYISDSFGLYDDLLVQQCLAHTAAMHGLCRAECKVRVQEISLQVGLVDLLSQRAGSLSRGQRQRVGIAQALLHKPQLLLLDEPAAGLDPEARQELAKLVLSLRDQGVTLLISSHILSELEDYSDSMLTLHDGRILGHVKIGHNAGYENTRQIRVHVYGDLETALMITKEQPNVHNAHIVQGAVVVTFSGDEVAQTGLLKTLVQREVQILSFAEQRVGMQSVYFAQIGNKGKA